MFALVWSAGLLAVLFRVAEKHTHQAPRPTPEPCV